MPEEDKEDATVWPPPPATPNDPNGSNESRFTEITEPRRNGCLTSWLVFALAAHAVTIALYSLAYPQMHAGTPTITPGVARMLIAAGIASIVCILALFRWRRWGFYGIVTITALTFFLNVSLGVGFGGALGGLIGIVLLYWVLHLGGQQSAWRSMK